MSLLGLTFLWAIQTNSKGVVGKIIARSLDRMLDRRNLYLFTQPCVEIATLHPDKSRDSLAMTIIRIFQHTLKRGLIWRLSSQPLDRRRPWVQNSFNRKHGVFDQAGVAGRIKKDFKRCFNIRNRFII